LVLALPPKWPASCWPPASESSPPRDSRHAASARPANPHSSPREAAPDRGVHGLAAVRRPANNRDQWNGHLPGPEKMGRRLERLCSVRVPGSRLQPSTERRTCRRSGIRDCSRARIDCTGLSWQLA
jgi:hypothetical protein